MDIILLTEDLNSRINNARNVLTLISRSDFQEVYSVSTNKEKAADLIKKMDLHFLRLWFIRERKKNIGVLSVRQLREMASTFKIPNYTKLPKALLLSELAGRMKNEPTPDSNPPQRNEVPHTQIGSVGGILLERTTS